MSLVSEIKTLSALVMDRSDPLGNSEDNLGRRALHVKIGNKPGEPIPIYVGDSGTNPIILNVSAPLANTEYQIIMPEKIKNYKIKSRKNTRMKIKFSPGGPWITVGIGGHWSDENFYDNLIIYFETEIADNVLEVAAFQFLSP